jgi:uncharacterized protein
MDIFIISLVAFFAAILTFFSGFGLGTILAPVFAIFFPIDIAIALTGVVHFTNNLFKIALVGKYAKKSVLLKFGIPAILAAFAGAWLLLRMVELPVLYEYELWGNQYAITPIKLVIAFLLIFFSVIEIVPSLKKIQFGEDKMVIGGALSGFFGGLTGIQGALRSAFLIKLGLSKEAFIGTGVVLAALIDFTRLSVYTSRYAASGLSENIPLLISATLAAIAGALLGKILLPKITLTFVQYIVASLLILISLGLGAGLI